MSNDNESGVDATRRSLLCALVAAASLTMPGVRLDAGEPAEAARLAKVISVLAGLRWDTPDQAALFLNITQAELGDGAVRSLLSGGQWPSADLIKSSVDGSLESDARAALNLWLTGMTSPTGKDGTPKVWDYTTAGAWRAIPYTKPPGVCAGAFGLWADPPVSG